MSQDKLDRKELKHDGLVDTVSRLSLHIQKHYGAYLAGAALCVVAAVAIGIFTHRARTGREDARERLAAAGTNEQLAAFCRDYADSPEAPVALLRLADGLFQGGEFALALERYRAVLNSYPGWELGDLAGMGEAYSLEAMGRYGEALEAYNSFPERFRDSAIVPEALFNSARCLSRLGRLDQALVAYREVVARYPRSVFAGFAQERVAALTPAPVRKEG